MIELEINNQTIFRVSTKKIISLLSLAQKQIKQKGQKNISLAFVSPIQIKKLNKIYRKKDEVTDVLSFEDDGASPELGEIIICVIRAQKQAREFKHSLEKEVLRLALHGYLHLSGYDHVKENEAVEMEALEEKLMHKFYAKN
ncbi:MAG: putative rRNA maturation factor [Parcubacteria group bacterium GW2011_GWC2_38_7]|nr:MAG: putative rRNA maturation factor [Parcubacteria group bacterium GW2011_GWC2_38_7]